MGWVGGEELQMKELQEEGAIITIPGACNCEKSHFVSSVAVRNALEQEHQFFSFVSLSACKIKSY